MDIKEVLDAAIAAGGGKVTLPTSGEATRWRQRAYEFRKYMRGDKDWSIYDRITLKKLDKESRIIIISVVEQEALFTPVENGTPIEDLSDQFNKSQRGRPKAAPKDELLETAQSIARDLGIDL